MLQEVIRADPSHMEAYDLIGRLYTETGKRWTPRKRLFKPVPTIRAHGINLGQLMRARCICAAAEIPSFPV